ncbi:MAG: hypothetical protein A3B96_01130 [Candidatus Spechtbacteria bacterium RIFCSPHIGHO2_02_FULL_43_15b]|uniref:UDP-glucose/GDP-mannose dehydrogenase dimerisation domain-containing protein n=1 Tax=Candidatus Spechtbacteria bacterium RIFCSPHIGHO2_01_FULL_43_30 TaxID=1802158 RepID=A0A1G2H4T3_9BACT|nr:MAG: hypothetical protein A2827_03530 [Candidatus Spechtbacteria bacterium RIFCSPHIGHO2_01_FULL_43_30]OGZ59017.1 MAG: hypothetical protein A3B96_01130 [Candidatus Spechtbacteria bacterium RIFCSPHIGHO2_02_FULL_43_15b]
MYKQTDIGIIGAGFVGGAIKNYFKKAKIWDKYKDAGNSFEEVVNQPIIFVCLPTPFSSKNTGGVFRGADISAIEENLAKIPAGRVVVIKSTISPGTVEHLQKKYPSVTILFNPEFLTAAVAKKDFQNPDKQIIGYADDKGKKIAKEVIKLLPKPFVKKNKPMVIPALEAEFIKYSINNYYSMKVIFANQIYDVCQKIGADYDIVRKGFTQDKRICDSHFDVWHGGFRGYSGACLPKDIKTFIQFAGEQGVDLKLHKVVDGINEELLNSKEKTQRIK